MSIKGKGLSLKSGIKSKLFFTTLQLMIYITYYTIMIHSNSVDNYKKTIPRACMIRVMGNIIPFLECIIIKAIIHEEPAIPRSQFILTLKVGNS